MFGLVGYGLFAALRGAALTGSLKSNWNLGSCSHGTEILGVNFRNIHTNAGSVRSAGRGSEGTRAIRPVCVERKPGRESHSILRLLDLKTGGPDRVLSERLLRRHALVIVIDDQTTGRTILAQLIRSIDDTLEVVSFGDSREALAFVRVRTPDLILTDYKMPYLDGTAFTREVRKIPACADVPLVMVTIIEDKRVRYEALDAGATDFLNRPIDQYECRARCRNLLTLRSQQQIIRNRAKWLEDQVALATNEIQSRERETLLRLAKAGEYRDEGTGNHVLRIAKYSRAIACTLGLPPGRCEEIELASPMHDIGKIGVPDAILLKVGPLTPEELALMQIHTVIGYEILRDSPSRHIQLGAVIALNHHEKFDGTGYPSRLKGDAIPLSARIVAIADVYDALTTARPYKQPWPQEEVMEHIQEQSGQHFDPECVEAFVASMERIEGIQSALRDADGESMSEANLPLPSGTTG